VKAAWGAAPAALVVVASYGFVLVSSRSPTRLVLERAWASPSLGLGLPLGAGEGGIDLLAAVSHAAARGITLAFAVAVIGLLIGAPLGAAAGLRGGTFATAVARACDLVQSFPTFLLALAVLSVVRAPTRVHMAVVFCLSAWAPFARLALLQARVLSAASFVEAARALGVSERVIVFRHILPNLLGPVAVQAGAVASAIVLGEAALGFIGLGPRDGVSLGALLEQGILGMLGAPHVLITAAVAVSVVSGSLQLSSEALRTALGRRDSLEG
jgi:peptide/nickel transport system permease protein